MPEMPKANGREDPAEGNRGRDAFLGMSRIPGLPRHAGDAIVTTLLLANGRGETARPPFVGVPGAAEQWLIS